MSFSWFKISLMFHSNFSSNKPQDSPEAPSEILHYESLSFFHPQFSLGKEGVQEVYFLISSLCLFVFYSFSYLTLFFSYKF